MRHLREFVQKSREITPRSVEVLARHYIHRPSKTADDKDRIGMLLAEYVCVLQPMLLREARRITPLQVASALEPIIGRSHAGPLPAEIQSMLDDVAAFKSLGALLANSILEQGRRWKYRASFASASPGTLITVTYYNLFIRAAFYRLLHAELHRIHDMLDELRSMQVQTVDATGAGLLPDEPLSTLRELCVAWTQPVRASYADGQAFTQVLQVSDVLARALGQATGGTPEPDVNGSMPATPPGKHATPPAVTAAPELPASNQPPEPIAEIKSGAGAEAKPPRPETRPDFSPQRWLTQAALHLQQMQPVIRVEGVEVSLSWLEAEIFYSNNALYKQVLTEVIVLRALVQHAAADPSLPGLACYEFAVVETTRLTKLLDTVREGIGDVPARKLAAALDRVFEALVSLRESTG